jgi:hypothetical protein
MASETFIRKADVDSLARKLEKFAEGLPEQEQGVLGWALARARATTEMELSESDLEGAAGGNTSGIPMNQMLAGAAGLSDVAAAEASDSVKWTHTF